MYKFSITCIIHLSPRISVLNPIYNHEVKKGVHICQGFIIAHKCRYRILRGELFIVSNLLLNVGSYNKSAIMSNRIILLTVIIK